MRKKQGPLAIIFLDEVEAIAPRRDLQKSNAERRLVNVLLDLIDSAKGGWFGNER